MTMVVLINWSKFIEQIINKYSVSKDTLCLKLIHVKMPKLLHTTPGCK